MSTTPREVEFVRSAIDIAGRAVTFEIEQNFQAAIHYYYEAHHLLQRALYEQQLSDQVTIQCQSKSEEYLNRITQLTEVIENINREQCDTTVKKSTGEIAVDKAKFLISDALLADEQGCKEDAVKLYTAAVELCLQVRVQKDIPAEVAEKLTTLAKQGLERAEVLKGVQFNTETPVIETRDPGSQDRGVVNQRRAAACQPLPPPSPSSSTRHNATGGNSDPPGGNFYSEDEKKVLLGTSSINGISYMPFLSVDLKEKFTYVSNFDDPDGLLSLSPKQRSQFRRWSRPHELFSDPQMIRVIDSFSIKQTLVSDCSMIASLAISANYEKRFGKKLIRNIIYPQNKNEDPVVNPSGKYMVKLLLNGVRRKVVIDDMLPTGSHNQLLCSYSNNKGELWVSLLEKAYMKVMGGYDFPGSNSNIDLHALTGWIPERRSIVNDTARDKTFYLLLNKMAEGHVLVTVATGEMDDRVADRAGLVPTHAYAVLDVREVKGVKLLLVKNPWSHLRWRGNYSEIDGVHWTEEMKRAVNYNPNNAQMFDNGVFWIDYDSICKFFDVLYMNWNPDLFQYTYCVHRTWSHTSGPIKDVYSIGENPQYSLETNSGGTEAAVWILLTRHITDIIDFKDNREYITVLVYDTDGKKVYYPNDPEPLVDGVRINSPHYLCKLITPRGITTKRYTLVISQYEKTTTIHYTLRVYASCPFKMGEIVNTTKYRKRIVGEWTDKTAGGCANYPGTTMNNPTYRLELKHDGKLVVDLKGPKEYNVGFDVICTNSGGGASSTGGFYKKSSGSYRPGFVVLDLGVIPAGIYNIVPSTFQPGCKGPFFLNCQSTSGFDVSLVP